MKFAVTTYSYYIDSLGDPVWRGVGVTENGDVWYLDVKDESIRPRMYVVVDDFDIFMESIESAHMDGLILKIEKDHRKTIYGEECYAVYVRIPAHVKKLRDAAPADVKTAMSDIPWEKNVVYMLNWGSPFFEIPDEYFDPYGSRPPLEVIKNGDEYSFKPKRRIAYWDIETDNSAAGINDNPFMRADIIPILSYVLIDPLSKEIIYYANSRDFEDTVYEDVFSTAIPEDILSLPNFKEYPREWKLTVKLFKMERDMHKAFINEFAERGFNELVTFNGRGGNVHFRGKREWHNGYDMPLFYRRCVELGLESEIQKMSPFPPGNNVYERKETDDKGGIVKYEIFIRGVAQHDLYYDDMVLMYTKGKSMKRHNLDTFLETFLGIHKVEHKGESVWELFYRDWKEEMHYNIVDVEGLYALDVKLGYTEDIWMRSSMFNIKIEDVVYTAKAHDHITLLLMSKEILYDTRGTVRNTRYRGFPWYAKKKIGGFNLEPKPGLYGYNKRQYGVVLDFKSLYPSTISSLNAGPMTKIELSHLSFDSKGLWLVDYWGRRYAWNDVCRSVNGGFFRKDIESVERRIYRMLNEKRDGVKKIAHKYEQQYLETKEEKYRVLKDIYSRKEYAVKPFINGRFGATGYEGSRTFDIVIYNTPTATGQYLIKSAIEYIEENGYEVVLASTDSAFVMLKETDPYKAFDEAKKIRDEINTKMAEIAEEELNVYDNQFRIEIEKLFDSAIIINKRYYVLRMVIKEDRGDIFFYEKPQLYVKGMEIVRRDSAEITDKIQRDVINMILNRRPVEHIRKYLQNVNRRFDKLPWSIICPRAGISGNVNSGSGAKYEACRNANRILGKYYDSGANPLYAKFIRHPNKFNGVTIPSGPINLAFDEEDEEMLKKYGFVPDYNHLKETHFFGKIDKLTQLLEGKDCRSFIMKKGNLEVFL